MNNLVKNITLTAALLSFTASAQASDHTDILNDSAPGAQSGAIRAAGETKDITAIDDLIHNVESYLVTAGDKGPYEENLKARLKAIDSIWALGEIGAPRVMSRLEEFYAASDDIVRLNLVISMGKLKANPYAAPYLRGVAGSAETAGTVRAAAFEMLEEMGQPAPIADLVPSRAEGIEAGDLIYTGGIVGDIGSWFNPDLPIGHSGIFSGTEIRDGRIYVLIADCVPNNFVPPGVRNIRLWKHFTHHFKFPYYGNRTSKVRPTKAQREKVVKMAREMGAKGLRYSDSHFSQKGPKEFDCVGYTEYIYEAAGLNPTPNKYETGLGWPLTPWEQFEAAVPNVAPQVPYSASAETTPTPAGSGHAAQLLDAGLFGVAAAPVELNIVITPARAD